MVFEVKDGGIVNGQRRRMGVGREHLRKVSKAASGEACLGEGRGRSLRWGEGELR